MDKLLVVEDEVKVASFIRKGLEESGYEVVVAHDGLLGKALIEQNNFSLLILDVNLPGLNGLDLSRELRSRDEKIPVIMLTALGTTEDKVKGFESGADDYLVKPFEFRELLARIKALLKRSQGSQNKSNSIRIADLELNTDMKVAYRAGKLVELTAKEYSLLEYLIINKNKVLSRSDIALKIWDLNFDTGTNVIDVYINFLRKKIDKDHPVKLIHTQVGMGYILKEPK